MPRTQDRRYVIFAGPEQHSGRGSRYVAEDGTTITGKLRQAASFVMHAEALEFAKGKNITLDDVTRYIGLVDFTPRRT